MKKEKNRWATPQIESLEINTPAVCNRPWMQGEVCEAQGEPQTIIPCASANKGTANQPLS